MEWIHVVSPSDGGHCVHDVLFLTVMRLMEIKGVSVQVKLTHVKSEHDQLHLQSSKLGVNIMLPELGCHYWAKA